MTFSWGFLKTGLPQASEAFRSWLKSYSSHFETIYLDGSLDKTLEQMQPLTLPASKRLLISTQSNWIACFENGVKGADLLSFMSILTTHLNCEGLVIRCATDKRMYSPHDKNEHFTNLGFDVFAPGAGDSVGPIRSVSLTQYYGKWKFKQGGNLLRGEIAEQYKMNPVQRRVTLESIDTFCHSLGLSPFAPSFYLNRSCLISMQEATDFPISRSLIEAQATFFNASELR